MVPVVGRSGTMESLRIIASGSKPDPNVPGGNEDTFISVQLEDFDSATFYLEIYEGDIPGESNTFWDNAANFGIGNLPPPPVPNHSFTIDSQPDVTSWGTPSANFGFGTFLLSFDLQRYGIALQEGHQYVFVLYHQSSVMRLRVKDSAIQDPQGWEDLYQGYDTPPTFYSGIDPLARQMSSHYTLRVEN